MAGGAKQEAARTRPGAHAFLPYEVLTMEIVGEFLGIDDENGLYAYFRRHYAEWFPALREVHRTTFTRQMAYPCGLPRSGCGENC